MSVRSRYLSVLEKVKKAQKKSENSSENVTVIGVSKLQPFEILEQGVAAGVRDLGENYVQEFLKKYEQMHSVSWHFIGPLQTNKVKFVVGKVGLIHTLDRVNLLNELNKQAQKLNIVQSVLIQVNVAEETTKSGILIKDLFHFAEVTKQMQNIKVMGLMTMPPFQEDSEVSRPFFKKLRELRDALNDHVYANNPIAYLSMGTSQDFEVAVEEGATHIRVGTLIFGERVTK